MNEIKIETPKNINELLKGLNIKERKYILAGGTDLIIQLRNEQIRKGILIDITGIKELKQIKLQEKYISIGSAVTYRQIIDSALIKKYATCLIEASEMIGSTQIRNTATIGGNVANAFAGADIVPPLIAVNSLIKVLKADGTYSIISIQNIIKSSGKNALREDEIIIEILIPVEVEEYRTAFAKIGSRSTVTISKLNIAGAVRINKENNTITDINIILGCLGAKAFQANLAEKTLKSKKISWDVKKEFVLALVKEVDMAIPNRSSLYYKREAIRGLAEEIFSKLFRGYGYEEE